ncbi:MAG: oligopeptide/dipeptide transporter, ATPase subunit [Frankiales bacterium]|nr:oligopeptide/dipeptide transporter, ATPase subunit [Frankiales bacterium]
MTAPKPQAKRAAKTSPTTGATSAVKTTAKAKARAAVDAAPPPPATPLPAVKGATVDRTGEEPVLQVRNLVKHFPVRSNGVFRRTVGEIHAVCDVSFDVYRGETLGIVGESGCGKSTTGRAILKLQPATSGEVIFNGRDVTKLEGAELRQVRRDMQLVFQDPYASLNPRMTINDIVTEPLKIHGIGDKTTWHDTVSELLRTVGLNPEHGNRYPHEFSGGQRQRIGIARALALEPKILVLDEPVSALDVSIQAGVVNLLEALQDRLGLSYVFIAHDLSVVRHIADRVAVMYLGHIVEIATRDGLFDTSAHPYTRALLSAIPIPDPRKERERRRIVLQGDVPSPANPPSGCRFRTRCQVFRDQLDDTQRQACIEQVPALEDRGQGHPVACHYPVIEQVV